MLFIYAPILSSSKLSLGESRFVGRTLPLHRAETRSIVDVLFCQHTSVMTEKYIESTPYNWPFNGNLTPQNTCIIVIVREGMPP
jgi:hypothetical protein